MCLRFWLFRKCAGALLHKQSDFDITKEKTTQTTIKYKITFVRCVSIIWSWVKLFFIGHQWNVGKTFQEIHLNYTYS